MEYTREQIRNATQAIESWSLGQTSRQFETSGRGVATISTGRGDHGGVSYGAYQLSTNQGTIQEYLRFAKDYQDDFRGLTPATAAFNQKWLELARSDPNFAQSQHDFIKQKHFEPQMEALASRGFDLSDRGRAVQDMVWSTAVQTRNLTPTIIIKGIEEKFGKNVALSDLTDKQIIEAAQEYKINHNSELFGRSRALWNGLLSRATNEKSDLLKLATNEEIYQEVNKKVSSKDSFGQSAQQFLDKRGRVEGDLQVYRGDTYTFEKQANTLTVHRHGNEILKQVGDQIVVDKVTPLDVKALSTVNQYLDKVEQQTKEFAKASLTILERQGHTENGSQVLKGNLYSFEKLGDTLTVHKYDQEIFKQVGDKIAHNQVTQQDAVTLHNVAQSLVQKEQNLSQRMNQHQEPVRAGIER
jgi:hypothetical protein